MHFGKAKIAHPEQPRFESGSSSVTSARPEFVRFFFARDYVTIYH
jgi:hypothetical protein